MEEIEGSAATEAKPIEVIDGTGDAVTTIEQSQEMGEARTAVVDDDAPVLEAPKGVVEVVIKTKIEGPVEEPILPDHYYDNGNVPVFKPTMEQFRDFEKFINRINSYGMEAGIVKIIPPPEWREALPPLDEKVKSIKLKNAIEQQFVGSGGVLRQNNIEKRRVYNLPQWREVCESTDHQPPAKRGEVRQAGHIVGKRKAKPKKKANRKKAKQVAGSKAQVDMTGTSTAVTDADGIKAAPQQEKACENCWTTQAPVWRKAESGGFLCNACGLYLYKRGSHRTVVRPEVRPACLDNPPTEQPSHIPSPEHSAAEDQFAMQIDKDADAAVDTESMNVDHPVAEPITRPHTPLSPPTLKRKRSPSIGPEGSDSEAEDDADDFQNFDYRINNASEYTVERCKELERFYWKTVTFNSPMYGADMPGSLFDDSTETWNVAKLDNLLCRIGKTIPGVNSAYLYLGMWKATFSWHVEDMDLYSINYIHFGAPKQWYSINQCDAEKFEAVMRSNFPNDHKGCPQFMRHKTFLASPAALEAKGIKVNRLVHHEGEFVITFPFGYHSGYNLGYNCAESVNFATEEWLEIGRDARKCNCAEDSVTINVDDIIDAIRGGPFEDEAPLTPPDSVGSAEESKKKKKERKVKAENAEKKATPKKLKPQAPCMLCPYDPPREPLLPAEGGKQAHRRCAEYIPETYITATEEGQEIVAGTEGITPARWNLKCLYCSSTRGAKFQCSVTQCCRAYHATCAAAAGVLVETAVDEQGFVSSYQCRFHRPRRVPLAYLENDPNVAEYASKLQPGDSIQARFAGMDHDVPFVGMVVENCASEETVVIELANGEPFEVAYKWILPPPKRDVRALCANQSTGSTKKRQKKVKKTETAGDAAVPSTSVGPETTSDQTTSPQANAGSNAPFAPIPSTQPPNLGQSSQAWSRNPALAQYHQYVWQVQQEHPKAVGSEDAFKAIMQRLQATPARSAQPVLPRPPQTNQLPHDRPEIVLPPPQFNMGQPPPSLLPPGVREPLPQLLQPASYTRPVQVLQLQPNPPSSHPLHIPPFKPRPAINIQQNPWAAQTHGISQLQNYNPQPQLKPRETQSQQEFKQAQPRPLAPSPTTQISAPIMPPFYAMPAQPNGQGQNPR